MFHSSFFKRFTICFLLMFTFFEVNAQYTEISGKALESHIFQNHQAGRLGFEGLFTKMVIEVEDFDLLKNNFIELKGMFEYEFTSVEFNLDENKKRIVIVYDRTLAKTDDFLKIFKETILKKGVLLYLYDEQILIKL